MDICIFNRLVVVLVYILNTCDILVFGSFKICCDAVSMLCRGNQGFQIHSRPLPDSASVSSGSHSRQATEPRGGQRCVIGRTIHVGRLGFWSRLEIVVAKVNATRHLGGFHIPPVSGVFLWAPPDKGQRVVVLEIRFSAKYHSLIMIHGLMLLPSGRTP